ncbi:MAG TPA: redoxin family protein [Candidatus Saccharimonadales bacterium]|nr:redoxin family protein [Candidatus Saccharimonadales bacterium]
MKFWIAITVIIGGFLAFLVFSKRPNTTIANQSQPPGNFASLVGKPAPNFRLQSLGGQTFNLSSLRGKKVVLFFNEGIMCYPACWNQMAALGSDNRLNNSQVVSASIIVDNKDEWGSALQRMPELGKSTILLDTDTAVSRQYGVLSLSSSMHPGMKPGHTYVVIDQNGIVRYTKDDPQMGVRNNLLESEVTKL